jgi:transposase-like protein
VAVVEVRCPECGSPEVVKYRRQANGEQRYRCNNLHCERQIFLLQYHNTGRLPEVKRQMVDMAWRSMAAASATPLGCWE